MFVQYSVGGSKPPTTLRSVHSLAVGSGWIRQLFQLRLHTGVPSDIPVAGRAGCG